MPYYATHVDEVAFHVSTFLEGSSTGGTMTASSLYQGPGDDDARSVTSDADGVCSVCGCVCLLPLWMRSVCKSNPCIFNILIASVKSL